MGNYSTSCITTLLIIYESMSAILVSPPNPKVVAAVNSVVVAVFSSIITSAFSGILFNFFYRNYYSNCITEPSRKYYSGFSY